MAQRPTFGALKAVKPASDGEAAAPVAPAPQISKPASRIQTSVRLDAERWAALNELATRKRIEGGKRVTVHDLLIEGVDNILALNGINASR